MVSRLSIVFTDSAKLPVILCLDEGRAAAFLSTLSGRPKLMKWLGIKEVMDLEGILAEN